MFLSVTHLVWSAVTALGEGLCLVPAAAGFAFWIASQNQGWRLAGWWLFALVSAALITAASKIAFIGWGVGSATWNFTGVSGHTMFSMAIYPLLFRMMLSSASVAWRRWAIVAGYALAIAIGVSRVRIDAHSWSEVLVGFIVGGMASGLVLAYVTKPEVALPRWLAGALTVWLLTPLLVLTHGSIQRPPTHEWVTQAALKLSGRQLPYTRADMHREAGGFVPPSVMLRERFK